MAMDAGFLEAINGQVLVASKDLQVLSTGGLQNAQQGLMVVNTMLITQAGVSGIATSARADDASSMAGLRTAIHVPSSDKP